MTVHEEGVSDALDAFEIFDRGHGAGTIRDPYPRWAELRRESAVHEGDVDAVVEAGGTSIFGDRPVYSVLGYDAVAEVLLDGERFSTDVFNEVIGPVLGRVILGMGGAEHRAHRGIVQQAFSRRAMADWERNVVTPIVNDHLERVEELGRADLVRDLTFHFPVYVIAEMLGLPKEDLADFHRWSVEMLCLVFDPEMGFAGSEKLARYFAPLVAARRRDPRNDLISTLASGEVDGQTLTDEEIISFLRFLLEAGAETTYRSTSNLLFGLLSQPPSLDEVRADRSLVPQTIEEALRWEPPLTGIFRGAAIDSEVAGVKIPEGAVVAVNVGAANRDESRWDRPDVFDIHRTPVPHIAFGYGPHVCLGMHLARVETSIALNAVLDRLPNVRFDPDAEDVHISGSTFRSPRALPVVFD